MAVPSAIALRSGLTIGPVVPPVLTEIQRRPSRVRSRSAPTLTFPDAPSLYPWLARRFSPGEATVWVGPAGAVESLLELLYVGVVATGGRVSLLEGANRFHPYRIGERARALGVDPGEALDRIRLARAFTAYQMGALVERWAREVRTTRPTLLVAHELPALFFASEFPPEERGPLLHHIARTLAELARSTGRSVLVTSTNGFTGFPGLKEEGPRLFDLVRVRPGPAGVRLEAYREAAHLDLLHRPDGQRGLEEFVEDASQEVTAWAGRYRPIGRRSRSG
jgi:hypothetical protein